MFLLTPLCIYTCFYLFLVLPTQISIYTSSAYSSFYLHLFLPTPLSTYLWFYLFLFLPAPFSAYLYFYVYLFLPTRNYVRLFLLTPFSTHFCPHPLLLLRTSVSTFTCSNLFRHLFVPTPVLPTPSGHTRLTTDATLTA